jgi:hypothetical protein
MLSDDRTITQHETLGSHARLPFTRAGCHHPRYHHHLRYIASHHMVTTTGLRAYSGRDERGALLGREPLRRPHAPRLFDCQVSRYRWPVAPGAYPFA